MRNLTNVRQMSLKLEEPQQLHLIQDMMRSKMHTAEQREHAGDQRNVSQR